MHGVGMINEWLWFRALRPWWLQPMFYSICSTRGVYIILGTFITEPSGENTQMLLAYTLLVCQCPK